MHLLLDDMTVLLNNNLKNNFKQIGSILMKEIKKYHIVKREMNQFIKYP
jgi:hypothetical protein